MGSQFKTVRFALVAYRDYAPGEGTNGYIVKKYEFTGNLVEMQKYVDFMVAGGGDDIPEAMSTALATAAGLAWNTDAMQIMIHIGDACPHGISVSGLDNYPDGDPDGHDALRVAHILAKKGIPIYNVYCGDSYRASLTETFYHALSHITNGQCLSLSDAETLSKIVLGAALEEQTMNRISQKIGPVWDEVHERHPNARDDQIIYELHQRLKADNFKVKCILGGKKLSKWAKKSVETIAFCTDLKQVKAMQTKAGESLEFYDFDTKQQITDKEQTRMISEGQVRKWYKRNKELLAIAKFKKEGCQYAQPCWQAQAADERYNCGELARFGPKSMRPWAKASARDVSKVFNEAGKLAKKGKKSTSLFSGSVAKPSPSGGSGRGYTPPHRRNVGPSGAPWNAAPTRAPHNPAPGAGRGARWNAAPGPQHYRQPQPVAPLTGSEAPRPMSRNTSYPVPVTERSGSRSSSSHFPGRGAPIQSIRSSRSSSRTRAAPSRSSRSNSREPQNSRMPASHAPAPSRPPRTLNPPAARSAPTPPSTTTTSKSIVITFDSKHIIHDYIVNKLKMAGVNAPTRIAVEDGRVRVKFPTPQDAEFICNNRISYDNGAPMEINFMGRKNESKV